MNQSQRLELSATKMAYLVRTQQISPLELVRDSLEQLERVNPQINAVAEKLNEQAIHTAHELENLIFSNPEKYQHLPLLGVPVTVKEMFAMQGCLRTAGNVNYKDQVMSFDSTLVARLKSAGAIPVCTANVPELGFWFETDNVIYGRTCNPYDFKRTAGGSTGGDAALVSSLVAPIGIGSDIGGSIRIPASFCGIYGHKPTWRRLPKTGYFPASMESMKSVTKETDSITTMGFLCRCAEDLPMLMEVLSGPDQTDPTIDTGWKHKTDFQLNPSINKIYLIDSPKMKLCAKSDTEVSQVVKKAAEAFKNNGFEVIPLESDLFFDALEIWSAVTGSTQSQSFYNKMTNGHEVSLFKELARHLFGQPQYTFPALITCVLELFKKQGINQKGLAKSKELDQRLKDILGENNLILMPVHSRVAPKHRQPYLRPFDFCMTGFLNPFGIPATSVPAGLNKKGLPLSVQVIAGYGHDHLNFAAAQFLDQVFRGYQRPQWC